MIKAECKRCLAVSVRKVVGRDRQTACIGHDAKALLFQSETPRHKGFKHRFIHVSLRFRNA